MFESNSYSISLDVLCVPSGCRHISKFNSNPENQVTLYQ